MISFQKLMIQVTLLSLVILSCHSQEIPSDPAFQAFAFECSGAFHALNFSVTDYDRYDQFFSEESTFLVPQAGIYKGPQGIEEYNRFIETNGESFSLSQILNATFSPLTFDPVNRTCTFMSSAALLVEFKPPLYLPSRTTFTVFYMITFDLQVGKIGSILARVPDAWIQYGFSLLRTETVHNYICDTLQSNCGEISAMNAIASRDDCVGRLAQLQNVSPGGQIDGSDLACRTLHSIFARRNSDHCPHISFIPLPDKNGDFKCQQSAGLTELDVFPPELLQHHSLFEVEQGIDPRLGFSISCVDLPAWKTENGEGCDCEWVAADPLSRCGLYNATIGCAGTCDPSCSTPTTIKY